MDGPGHMTTREKAVLLPLGGAFGSTSSLTEPHLPMDPVGKRTPPSKYWDYCGRKRERIPGIEFQPEKEGRKYTGIYGSNLLM